MNTIDYNNLHTDYLLIIMVIIGAIFLSYYTYKKDQDKLVIKNSLIIFCFGIINILISIIIFLINYPFEVKLIAFFLTLKEIENTVVARHLGAWGYLMCLWGSVHFVCSSSKSKLKNSI